MNELYTPELISLGAALTKLALKGTANKVQFPSAACECKQLKTADHSRFQLPCLNQTSAANPPG